jgi:DUF4097 and DUF4098 domain-containing protein YvlB
MRHLSFLAFLALLVAMPAASQSTRERERERERERREREDRHRDADEDSQDFRSVIDTTVAFTARGTIDLSLVSGEIRVSGWSQNQVKLHATSERGIIQFDYAPSRLSLDVRSQRGRMGDTRYTLSVPVGARVLMRSVSGEIYIREVKGETEARSVSGDIEIADALRTTFESVSGEVMVTHVAGNLRGNAVSGSLTIRDVAGDVDVETVSGDIQLLDVRSKFVRTETVSGDVEYQGTTDDGGRYEFHAHSGDVRLSLGDNVGATFDVETFSGTIDSEFPITLEPGDYAGGRSRPKRFTFKVGNGGARITTETFSGDIEIAKGRGTSRD